MNARLARGLNFGVGLIAAGTVCLIAPLKTAPLPQLIAQADEAPIVTQRILPAEFEIQAAEQDEDSERPASPEGAAAFRRLQLQNENGEIPPEAPAKAAAQYEYARTRAHLSLAPSAGGISPGTWTFEGPTNIGGRVRSIVIPPAHPEWLVIGSVSGGTWINKNDGAGWGGSGADGASNYLANLAVTTLIAHPILSNTLYAGTGEGFGNVDGVRGDGIFVSHDSGQTWGQLPSTRLAASASFSYVNRLAISADGVYLFAATGSGLHRSSDGGSSWTPLLRGGRMLDVKTHPTVATQVIAAAAGATYYSLNSGQTWALSAGLPRGRMELAWSASSPNVVFASVDNNRGELYKSVNAGANFTLINTGQQLLSNQGWYDNAIWVNPVNVNDIIVAGVDAYRSTNGGISFVKIGDWIQYATTGASIHADHHAIVSAPGYDGINIKTLWFGNDAGLFRVDDLSQASVTGGYAHIKGPSLTQFYGMAASDGNGTLRIVGGAQDVGSPIQHGLDAWRDIYGGDGGFTAIDPGDSDLVYVEYVYLQVARSTDGGATNAVDIDKPPSGALLDSRSPNTALFIAPFILDPNRPSIMLAGGASLWRSANITATQPTWAAIKPPVVNSRGITDLISAIAVAPGHSDVIWVGYQRGSVFVTTNGTSPQPSWKVITNTELLTGRYVTRIVINPVNPHMTYVTFGGYAANNVWMTPDDGASWKPLPGTGPNILPEAPVRTLAVHPLRPDLLYAGTEVGLFASEDAGANWTVPPDGPVNVSVDELVWLGNRLYAATYGRGIWSTRPKFASAYIPDVRR